VPPMNGQVYMDAVLTPNRSLSDRGMVFLVGGIAVLFFLSSLVFLQMGALPVLGFFGLDLLAIWLAFRLSFRRQREQTRIVVTANTLQLHHRDARGREKRAEVPSAFARIELDEPLSPTSWLRVEYGQTAYVIGKFLTPDERRSLAQAMRGALQAARAERNH
jgi:uncharacterized membrane protein